MLSFSLVPFSSFFLRKKKNVPRLLFLLSHYVNTFIVIVIIFCLRILVEKLKPMDSVAGISLDLFLLPFRLINDSDKACGN